VVFFSYRTKHESQACDQFWKFSRQCSIFGRIGDQWVAISSPVRPAGSLLGTLEMTTRHQNTMWRGLSKSVRDTIWNSSLTPYHFQPKGFYAFKSFQKFTDSVYMQCLKLRPIQSHAFGTKCPATKTSSSSVAIFQLVVDKTSKGIKI